MPRAFKWAPEELQDMVASYKQGETAQSIASRYGTSYQVILPVLVKHGVQARTRREARQKHTYEERFFQTIDTEEKAYWLGFFTADGCVTKGRTPTSSPKVKIHLGRQDYSHLAKLKQALHASQEVNDGSLVICSALMASDLASHGILPKKTFSSKPAQVKPELERHYWRGVIDGDGHFTKDGRQLVLVGDYEVIIAFQAFVLSHCPMVKAGIFRQETIYRFAIKGIAARKMLDMLYGDATVYLERKYERAFPQALR